MQSRYNLLASLILLVMSTLLCATANRTNPEQQAMIELTAVYAELDAAAMRDDQDFRISTMDESYTVTIGGHKLSRPQVVARMRQEANSRRLTTIESSKAKSKICSLTLSEHGTVVLIVEAEGDWTYTIAGRKHNVKFYSKGAVTWIHRVEGWRRIAARTISDIDVFDGRTVDNLTQTIP